MFARVVRPLMALMAVAFWVSACSGGGGDSSDPCVGECEAQCKMLKNLCKTDCQMKFAGCLAGCYSSSCEASWSSDDAFSGLEDLGEGDEYSLDPDVVDNDSGNDKPDVSTTPDAGIDTWVNPNCSCQGMQCGNNGCGESCGACPQGKQCSAAFQCVAPMPTCDQSGFGSVEEAAKLKTGTDGFYMHYQNLTATQPPLDALVLEIDNQGTYNGPTGPGTYDVQFTSFKTGGLWLYILYGYTQQGYTKILVPIQGTMKITQLNEAGGQFGAVLQGVVMAEADLNQTTLEVTVLKNGMTWCLDNVILHAQMAVTKEVCVPEGSGAFIGDNIADFSLQNCNGDWVSLHDSCGKVKAMWLVLVAGW